MIVSIYMQLYEEFRKLPYTESSCVSIELRVKPGVGQAGHWPRAHCHQKAWLSLGLSVPVGTVGRERREAEEAVKSNPFLVDLSHQPG